MIMLSSDKVSNAPSPLLPALLLIRSQSYYLHHLLHSGKLKTICASLPKSTYVKKVEEIWEFGQI
jgi:hypothetical protein